MRLPGILVQHPMDQPTLSCCGQLSTSVAQHCLLLPSQGWTYAIQSRTAFWYEWVTSLPDLNPAFW